MLGGHEDQDAARLRRPCSACTERDGLSQAAAPGVLVAVGAAAPRGGHGLLAAGDPPENRKPANWHCAKYKPALRHKPAIAAAGAC